jgi:orotate phosphoribosyltransferase
VSEQVLELLTAAGALKEGHFLLASGRHSNRYIEKFDLLRNPAATEEVCHGFVDRFAEAGIDVVVGPTTGGILLAFEVARQMKIAAAYAERKSDGGPGREIRRGTTFTPGQRILVVDDILTSGGSVRETLAALEPHPVTIVGIGVLVDRSGGKVEFGDVPLSALATLDVETWEQEECPFCAQGVPLVKPGTTATPK